MDRDTVWPGAMVMLSPEVMEVVPTYYVAELVWPMAGETPAAWGLVRDAMTHRLASWLDMGLAVMEAHHRCVELSPAACVLAASRPIGSGPIKYGLVAPPDVTVVYVITAAQLREEPTPAPAGGRQSIERAIREAVHQEQAARERRMSDVHTPAK